MNKLGLILALLTFSQVGFARDGEGGFTVGNGGDVVVCRAEDGSTKVELLDYYEAREMRGILTEIGAPDITAAEKIDLVLARLAKFSPDWALTLKKQANEFLNNALLIPNVNLVDVPDSFHVALPKGCTIEQIINRRDPVFAEDKEFTINKDLWLLLDQTNVAGIILHELFYRAFKANNSLKVRYFNSVLATQRMESMSKEEFRQLLDQVDAPFMEFPGNIKLKPNARLKLNEDGTPKEGFLAERRAFEISQGPHIFDDFIRFYPGGKLRAAVIKEDRFIFKDTTLLMERWVEFSQDGDLLGGGIAEPISLWDSILNVDCTKDQVAENNTEFLLSVEGEIRLVQECSLTIKSRDRLIKIPNGNWKRLGAVGNFSSSSPYQIGLGKIELTAVGTTALDLQTGLLISTNLAQAHLLNVGKRSISFSPGQIQFHSGTDKIKSGILSQETSFLTIEGTQKVLKAGEVAVFDPDGNISN